MATWEVYRGHGGNVRRQSISYRGDIYEDVFVFNDPISTSRKSYTEWNKSIADIQDQAALTEVGGAQGQELVSMPGEPGFTSPTPPPQTREQQLIDLQNLYKDTTVANTTAQFMDDTTPGLMDKAISAVTSPVKTLGDAVVPPIQSAISNALSPLTQPTTQPAMISGSDIPSDDIMNPPAQQILAAGGPDMSYLFDKLVDLSEWGFHSGVVPLASQIAKMSGDSDEAIAKEVAKLREEFDFDVWRDNEEYVKDNLWQLSDDKTKFVPLADQDAVFPKQIKEKEEEIVSISPDTKEEKSPLDISMDGKRGYSPFDELGWNDVYQGFVGQMSIDSPGAYKYVIEQGLSNNPLLRTAQTQFLLQGKYNVLDTDDSGLGRYHTSGVLQGYKDNDRRGNPYWDFLTDYNPIQGQELINTIDNVIANINAPAGSIVSSDISPEDYNESQTQQLMWRQRFGVGNNALDAQQQLVALPILENTSPALRNEIAGVLSSLHNRWLISDRPEDQSWLEYARGKDYFGMVPDKYLTGQGD